MKLLTSIEGIMSMRIVSLVIKRMRGCFSSQGRMKSALQQEMCVDDGTNTVGKTHSG